MKTLVVTISYLPRKCFKTTLELRLRGQKPIPSTLTTPFYSVCVQSYPISKPTARQMLQLLKRKAQMCPGAHKSVHGA